MKWHWVLIVALMTSLIPGCGGGNSEGNAISDEVADGSDSPLVDGPSADVESSLQSEADGFKPPFPANSSFFSPPEVEKAFALPNSVAAEVHNHANVRVIGFSQIGDSAPQALLSISGHLQSMRAGDSVNGVTVVALEAPNVTLQQRNERWTVALFDQPIVNQQAGSSSQRGLVVGQSSRSPSIGAFSDSNFRSSSGQFAESRSSRGTSGGRSLIGISTNDLPPVPVSLPEESFAPMAELPDDLDLPEPPELPLGDLSVGLRLPGIDELPTPPSF